MDPQRTIAGSVALVSGANRGIGTAFVRGLLANDAARVYASARDPQSLLELAALDERVIPIHLDIRDDASVQAAAKLRDVNLLINNAGVAHIARLIGSEDLQVARQEIEVNYFGLLRMCRAFAPILAAHGGGTMVNLISILGRVSSPILGPYSASKAAAYSLTQGVRAELRAQGTLVLGVMPSYVDTDMTAAFDVEKITPETVVEATFEAIRTGQEDVYPGAAAKYVASQLLSNPKELELAFGQI